MCPVRVKNFSLLLWQHNQKFINETKWKLSPVKTIRPSGRGNRKRRRRLSCGSQILGTSVKPTLLHLQSGCFFVPVSKQDDADWFPLVFLLLSTAGLCEKARSQKGPCVCVCVCAHTCAWGQKLKGVPPWPQQHQPLYGKRKTARYPSSRWFLFTPRVMDVKKHT